MDKNSLPLNEITIRELFFDNEKHIYEIPVYQRNYAWEKDEIAALIQDVYDSYLKHKQQEEVYYIGTLVSYHKGDNVFEIIDGQQRLTTIRLILAALEEFNVLDVQYTSRLTYRARKKADETLKSIHNLNFLEEKESGLENGYRHVKSELQQMGNEIKGFKDYFLDNVHLIHYRVPKDIDLNHYFEVMNSRGEQLEQHEIVKANLMNLLGSKAKDTKENRFEKKVFNQIWEACSKMNVYVQKAFDTTTAEKIFGNTLNDFLPAATDATDGFAVLCKKFPSDEADKSKPVSINDIIENKTEEEKEEEQDKERKDSFQPIIDYPNFLLMVLKIIRLEETNFKPDDFTLDDKELLNEFDKGKMDAEKVRKFAYTLLKARFFLDNYIVHRTNEEETLKNNPWKLQKMEMQDKEWILKNLCTKKTDEETQKDDSEADDRASIQNKLINLLSMFEVSFAARQRKNYLLYCILYLLKCPKAGPDLYAKYTSFLENLANSYFVNIYMDASKLNEINTPRPGSFDEVILMDNKLSIQDNMTKPYNVTAVMFNNIYGDGEEKSKGVPLFVFNYLDYKIWKLYDDEVRGKQLGKNDEKRINFFGKLGCSDFDLLPFKQFYFSRTRRSLEHFFPQAKVQDNELTNKEDNITPSKKQINCLGNYAMIGSEANSSGSNWDPITKVIHYMDNKIKQVSVASLKFKIMMQICKDNEKWGFKEIQEHQKKMVALLTGDSGENIESKML